MGDEIFGEDDGVNIGDTDRKDSKPDESALGTGEARNSGTLMSKGSSKPSILRRSRDKSKNFKNDPFSSGVNSSKSPEMGGKKKKKGGPVGGLDKDSRDMIKNLETKIEEVRKTIMRDEITRIEMLMERKF